MGRRAKARRWAPWPLVAALVLASASASAQAPAATIALHAPRACPVQSELGAEIAALVGRPIDEITLPVGLDPNITITAEGARFVLEVHDDEGVRTLRDASCSALVRAAALIIALRIDADAATLAAATAAEPEPEPATPPAPAPPTPSRVSPRRARYEYDAFEWSRRLAVPYAPPTLPPFSIGAGVIVEAGIVPVVSASIAVDALFRVEHFEARIRAAYVLEQAQPTSSGVAASAALGTVLACGRPFDAEFPIAFCGGLETGPLLARSYGVALTGQSTAWTVAGVLGVWLPLTPWRGIDVSLGAEAWGRFYRPAFEIVGIGHVWDSDPFGGRFALLVHFSP